MAQAEQLVADNIEDILERHCEQEGTVDPEEVKRILVKRWRETEVESIARFIRHRENEKISEGV